MAGSDYSHRHPVCITSHPGHIRSGHDSAEETTVRRNVQPQLTGGGWSSTGDGKCSEGSPGGETHLRPVPACLRQGVDGEMSDADEPCEALTKTVAKSSDGPKHKSSPAGELTATSK